MKYEKLSNGINNKKVFLYGFITCAILLIIFNFFMSYAKYKSVDSVKLASGTINYENADLNIIAMYKNDGNGNEVIEKIPEGNYELSNESYCIIGSDKENKIQDVFEYKDKKVYIAIDKKGTKCYVYFEKQKTPSEQTLADLKLYSQGESQKGFKGTACGSCDFNENGVFQADDDYGTSYYFRGSVSNNWVKFGKKGNNDIYWRIIRINGNGTIRLIYAGETGNLGTSSTGKNAVDSKAYNSSYDDNKYVGFMYGGTKGSPSSDYAGAHKNKTKSDILGQLETWWKGTNLDDLLEKIDGATGFCNDRQPYDDSSSTSKPDTTNSKGYGKVVTYYGPYIRAYQTPTFRCALKSQDLFTLSTDRGEGNGALTIPIGLITADEVMYAGGYAGKNNTGYWLYTNQYYWTMSPSSWHSKYAYVLRVADDGNLHLNGGVNTTGGVRPVINLKANTKFKTTDGLDGTYQKPYEVA